MGMIGYLLRIEAKELDTILEDSSKLEEIIDRAMDESRPELIDLDKAWEGLLYMLTGHGLSTLEEAVPPLSWTLFSGQTVDEEQDLGYGPGNYCTVDQVKAVNNALQNISDGEMKNRFNAEAMKKENIYPGGIWAERDITDYLLQYFHSLKAFYQEAAEKSQAVITFIG